MWRPPGGLLRGGTSHKGRALVQLLLPLPGQPLKGAGLPLDLSPPFSRLPGGRGGLVLLCCHSPSLLQLLGPGAWGAAKTFPSGLK